MRSAERRGERGFTLIEVLVALAIVGLAVAAISGVFGIGLTAHETAADAETALALAEERLATAAVTPRPGTAKGEYAGRFAWQTTVSLYQDGKGADRIDKQPMPPLYTVAVSVAWRDGHRSRQLALSTLRLGSPTP